MSASITNLFDCINAKTDYRKIAVEDVRNALVNMPEQRIVIAQSRALRSLDRGIPLGKAISRAIAWARCAVEPSDDSSNSAAASSSSLPTPTNPTTATANRG